MGQGVWICWPWNSPRVQGGLLEGRRILGSSGNGNAGDNDVESNEAHGGSCEEEARNLITRNLNWLLSWKWELRLQHPCLLLASQHYQQVWKLRIHIISEDYNPLWQCTKNGVSYYVIGSFGFMQHSDSKCVDVSFKRLDLIC